MIHKVTLGEASWAVQCADGCFVCEALRANPPVDRNDVAAVEMWLTDGGRATVSTAKDATS